MRPMLASPGPASGPPAGPDWAHEIKWDGVRLLVDLHPAHPAGLRLTTRTERDVTRAFPELQTIRELGTDVLLDGEVVRLEQGRPSFGGIGERLHASDTARVRRQAASAPVTVLLFDLLRIDGLDLTGLPWSHRRRALESLVPGSPRWQVPPVYDDGRDLLDATADQGLEGVVSKRRSAPYRPGTRSPDWVKFPHRATRTVLIGGWRPQADSDGHLRPGRGRLGAVLVGEPGPDGLRYLGRVGSGLSGRAGAGLLEELGPLTVPTSPFGDAVPDLDARGTTWVRPALAIDVESLGLASGGRLRQPSYRGRRHDLGPEDL